MATRVEPGPASTHQSNTAAASAATSEPQQTAEQLAGQTETGPTSPAQTPPQESQAGKQTLDISSQNTFVRCSLAQMEKMEEDLTQLGLVIAMEVAKATLAASESIAMEEPQEQEHEGPHEETGGDGEQVQEEAGLSSADAEALFGPFSGLSGSRVSEEAEEELLNEQ